MDKTSYSNSQINQRLSLIQHLVDTSDLVLLIEGPTGSGKTVLANWLAETKSPNWASCFISAANNMSEAELLSEANRQIDDFFEDPDTLAGVELREKQLDLVNAGRMPVMIVDDAQNLSAEAMAKLLALNEPLIHQGVHASVMRLVLFGEDTIKLNAPYQALIEAHPDAVHLMHPPRLQLDDVSEYLEFKLKSAGFNGNLPFSDSDLQTFFWQSEGMPGKLNHVAQEFLQSPTRAINLPKELLSKRNLAIVAGAFIAGIVIFNLDWLDSTDVIAETEAKVTLEPTEIRLEPEPTLELASGGTEIEIAIPIEPESIPEPEPTPDPIPSSAVAPFENAPEPPIEIASEIASVDAVVTEEPTPTPPTPAPKPDAKALPEFTGPTLHGKEWILDQKGSHYTLQLIAVSNKGALLNLIPSVKARTHFASFETQPRGQSLHTLIYGSYVDKKAAQAAAEKLPASLKKLKPWPRPFSSIQTIISASQ